MPNHVVGHSGHLHFFLIAVEQLLPHGLRTIISRRIGYPWYIRIGQQIEIHRVGLDCLAQPLRYFSKRVLKPDFRHDQLGVEEVQAYLRLLPKGKRGYLFYLVSCYPA